MQKLYIYIYRQILIRDYQIYLKSKFKLKIVVEYLYRELKCMDDKRIDVTHLTNKSRTKDATRTITTTKF